ncbi:hypothetical protein WJX77_008336 [Trebouxia sp. C0004]
MCAACVEGSAPSTQKQAQTDSEPSTSADDDDASSQMHPQVAAFKVLIMLRNDEDYQKDFGSLNAMDALIKETRTCALYAKPVKVHRKVCCQERIQEDVRGSASLHPAGSAGG